MIIVLCMDTVKIDSVAIAPPAPRTRVYRLTEALKALNVGESFLADAATVKCYLAYARKKKFKVVQKQIEANSVRVWRLE